MYLVVQLVNFGYAQQVLCKNLYVSLSIVNVQVMSYCLNNTQVVSPNYTHLSLSYGQ